MISVIKKSTMIVHQKDFTKRFLEVIDSEVLISSVDIEDSLLG
jgi:hypothetical protein